MATDGTPAEAGPDIDLRGPVHKGVEADILVRHCEEKRVGINR